MVAYSFMKRFAELIDADMKPHTIRDDNHNNRHAKTGDELQLYTGMRTKQCRKLRDTECIGSYEIDIDIRRQVVYLLAAGEWLSLTPWHIRELAIKDGFESVDEFFSFFKERRDRVLIAWGEALWLDDLLGKNKKVVPRSGATFGTMPLESAREITSAVLACGFYDIGLSDGSKQPEWPVQYTLEEILIANRVVKKNPGDSDPGGTRTKMMHMADRGVAARYALASYGGNPEALLESLGYTLEQQED
jgi:hypothetical protein